MKILIAFSEVVLFAVLAAAQQQEKPRVFVTESFSSEIWGEVGGLWDIFAGVMRGGARPQTAEIIKTFGERCPNVIVTSIKERADYLVILDHEGGKSVILKDNKYALFTKDGDAIKSGATRSLGNSVKDMCKALVADRKSRN